jgi:WD40 repeat protein
MIPGFQDQDQPKVEPDKAHVARELVHKAPLIACRFDPRGRFVFATAEDRAILRWSLESAEATPVVFQEHDSWVFALGVSPDGETLLTGGGDGSLKWWPTTAEAPRPTRSVAAHDGWLRALAISPDGATIATAGNDRKVRLWSMTTAEPLMELPGHERPVYAVAFAPDGQTLVSGDLKGVVIEWDHRVGKEARRYDAAKLYSYNGGQQVDYGGVREMAFSPDGGRLACAGLINASNPLGAVSNPAILLFDRAQETPKEPLLQRPKEDIKGVGWGVRFHPEGFLILASGGTGGGHLWFFRPDDANEFAHFKLPNTARGLDLHPDGLHVATAHHDGKLRLAELRAKGS